MSSRIRLRAAVAAVVLCGVHVIIVGAGAAHGGGAHVMIFDFRPGGEPWRSIDDVVMGGVSSSEMSIEHGFAAFHGELSLENNGGFASVRSEPRNHDLSAFDGLVLRVRGDGKRYKVRLRTTASFDGPSYQATIQPAPGDWQEVRIPFDDFAPVFRGRRLPDHPPLDPAQVKTVGLLIADKQAGAFRLEIEWIAGSTERR